jgi:L-histidine Nalpha-methyltransferase
MSPNQTFRTTPAKTVIPAIMVQSPGLAAQLYRSSVRTQMSCSAPVLPTKYLFDDVGSELFAAFLEATPSHYSNIEQTLLREVVKSGGAFAAVCEVMELGAGDCSAFKTLLDLGAFPSLHCYCAIDISGRTLLPAVSHIAAAYPSMEVRAFIGDFEIERPGLDHSKPGQRLVCWLGNSAANHSSHELVTILAALRDELGLGALILLGVSLNGDPDAFGGFYAAGRDLFEEFRWNALERMNRECGADFSRANYRVLSQYNPSLIQGESVIEAMRPNRVTFADRAYVRDFQVADRIVVGITKNYEESTLANIIRQAGWRMDILKMDTSTRYALLVLK